MQTLDWNSYLKPPDISPAEHKAVSGGAFALHRDIIGKLCRILRPRSVVCMGAGYLNDIPLDTFVAGDADIYLVEWIDGITEQAFRHDLVKNLENRFVCLVCQCTGDPKKYCRNYGDEPPSPLRTAKPQDHCENFVPTNGSALCGNYAPGEFPRFLHADVTGGVAGHFARQVGAILGRAQKPQHAFREAVHVSARARANAPLPLADGSIDFITSSMVASQFDFEPYTYFLHNLYLRFGREATERNIDAINAVAGALRDNLFLKQVEAHCREMARLLKPDGRVYFSIEALHRSPPSDHWFYAEIAGKALEIVARHFLFDLDTLPEIIAPARTDMVRGTSIVHSYLLVPKAPPEKTSAQPVLS